MKTAAVLAIVVAAFAVLGGQEMASVEHCTHTAEQCRKF